MFLDVPNNEITVPSTKENFLIIDSHLISGRDRLVVNVESHFHMTLFDLKESLNNRQNP